MPIKNPDEREQVRRFICERYVDFIVDSCIDLKTLQVAVANRFPDLSASYHEVVDEIEDTCFIIQQVTQIKQEHREAEAEMQEYLEHGEGANGVSYLFTSLGPDNDVLLVEAVPCIQTFCADNELKAAEIRAIIAMKIGEVIEYPGCRLRRIE